MKKIAILIGILFAMAITSIAIDVRKTKLQKELANEVFRFHVLANSDSEKDQSLKMKVKEHVLAYMKQELPKSSSAEMTKQWARTSTSEIEKVAQRVIKAEGYNYQVRAKVMKCEFPRKTYGDVTFPAGEYEALRIEIGEAKGQNWWCVLYPNLCFIDAVHAVVPEEGKEELKKVLEEDTYEMVTATSRFRVGWFFF